MFRDLYAVARHTPLTLIITPRGEQLGVIVMPKPNLRDLTDESIGAALAKPFSIVGTPEELDTEFTAALARYSGSVTELRTALDLSASTCSSTRPSSRRRCSCCGSSFASAARPGAAHSPTSIAAARRRCPSTRRPGRASDTTPGRSA